MYNKIELHQHRDREELMMKLVLGADHGGFELKENIKEYLKEEGIEFTDYGTLTGDRCD